MENKDIRDSGFRRGLEIIWLAIIFLIPLFFNPASHQAFYLSKALLFQFLVMIMVGLALADWIWNRRARRHERINDFPSPLHLAILIFALIAIVATIVSITPAISFWGSWGRKEGLLTILCWVAFFLIVARHLRYRRQLSKAIYALLLSSGIVSILGIVQYFFPSVVLGYLTDGRVFSTAGNALSLSAFLAIVMPFTMALIAVWWSRRGRQNAVRMLIGLIALLILQFWCLWLAQYSITILLYIVSPMVFLVLLGIIKRQKLILGFGALSLLVVGVIAAVILMPLLFPSAETESPDARDAEYLISAETLELNTLGNRTQHWQNTIDLIYESPEIPFSNDGLSSLRNFIGYGPETFIVTYQSYHPEGFKSYRTHVSEMMDRPHNHYLYVAATMGLLGLFCFLSILCIFFYLSVRYLFRASLNIDKLLLLALVAGMVGYMVDRLFNPSTILTELVFWLMLSVVLVMGRLIAGREFEETEISLEPAKSHENDEVSGLVRVRLYLSIVCCILFVFIGLGITVKPFLADVYLQRGMNLSTTSSKCALIAFGKATELAPEEPVYWGHLGAYSYSMAQHVDDEFLEEELLVLSTTAYEKARNLERYVAYRYYSLAEVYVYWAEDGGENKWPVAVSLYDSALQLFPHNAVILNKWALALIVKGDLDGARAKLDEAAAIDPDWSGTAFLSGLLYAKDGKSREMVYDEIAAPIQEIPSQLVYFADFCRNIAVYHMLYLLEDVLEYHIQRETDTWITHAMLGITNFCNGVPGRSLAEFDVAMSIVPDEDAGGVFKAIFKLSKLSPDFRTKLYSVAPGWEAKLSRTVDSDKFLSQLEALVDISESH